MHDTTPHRRRKGRWRTATGSLKTLVGGLAALLLPAVAAVPLATEAHAATPAPALVTTQAQTVDGFGASGAWWVNDLNNYSSTVKSQVGDLLFGTSGLNLSIYRYNIGGNSVGVVHYPERAPQSLMTSPGTYDWTRDPGGSYFLQSASDHQVPHLIGFVNSAPAQWTTNGKSCDGSLVSGDEQPFATYLADVTAHWASKDVNLDYLSPMNEPDNSQPNCEQEGMIVPVSQRAAVLKAIGSTFAARSLRTGIIADESSRTSQLLQEAPTWLSDSAAAGYVTAFAHHIYDFPNDAALRRLAAFGKTYNKPLWSTEVCCERTGANAFTQQYDPTIGGGLTVANYIYRDFALGNDSSFQWWTALSNVIGCDVGSDPSCATRINGTGWNDGLIYYDPKYATDGNQSLYMTKRYYVLGQYSRYVRPGAVRYEISGAPSGVQAMAFWQNGAWTVVATNTNSSATDLSLDTNSGTLTPTGTHRTSDTEDLASVSDPAVSGSVLSASLPARSVTTFQLKSSGNPGSGGRTSTSTLKSAQSGKCLDDPGASTTDGTQVIIYACNGAANQNWTMTGAGELRGYGNKCLEAYGQGTANGTKVGIYTCNGGANQKWTLTESGAIAGLQSGRCIDVSNEATADGSPVALYDCNGQANQRWTRG
ncbi:glycoside hydrolase [Streptomyces sp. NPDC047043]|uniref:glycoside hydrolase n=1 Tax=Streptomyces sp. NPDC047043 TaxID=3154497 RepID=UPI0033D1E2CA